MGKIQELTAQLNRYRDEYYNSNAPSVSDEVYDRMYDELAALEKETGIRMGMAAGTDEAHDAEAVADRGTTYEIHQGTAITGMDAAGPPGPTAGTGL